MKDYLYVISLKGCPHSLSTEKLLEEYKIKNKTIKIDYDQLDQYRTKEISTCPQIYYVKNDINNKKLIGGNSDFQKIIELNNRLIQEPNNFDNLIQDYLNETKLKKKNLYRILFLINKDN
jgi:glutaredoxin